MLGMSAGKALLLAWVRTESRELLGRLGARMMIGEGWLALIGLASALVASIYFAVTGLRPWSATPPLLLHYLRWYMELGGIFLVLASMLSFAEHLAPRRAYGLLPYIAPLSLASLHIPSLAAAAVANLIALSVGTLPALIIIGLWAGAGASFFWSLAPAAVVVAVSAALLGALLALPVALLIGCLHRRWRNVPASIGTALLDLPSYLLVMWFLPRLVPAMPFPVGTTIFSLAGGLLTAAALAQKMWAGWILAVCHGGLAIAFCAVFTWVRAPLEGYAHKKSHPLHALSFRQLPLFRAELLAHLPLFLLTGAATGLAAGFLLRPIPDRSFPSLFSLAVLVLLNLALVMMVAFSRFVGDPRPLCGVLAHPASLCVLRTSPYARGTYFLQLYLGLLARTGLQIFLALSIYAGMLGRAAEIRQVLGYFPAVLLCLVLPAVALWQAGDLLSFRPRRDAQGLSLVWFLVWVLAVAWLFMSTGFLHGVPTTVLVWRTAAFTALYGAAAGGLFGWAAWRVGRMDWV